MMVDMTDRYTRSGESAAIALDHILLALTMDAEDRREMHLMVAFSAALDAEKEAETGAEAAVARRIKSAVADVRSMT